MKKFLLSSLTLVAVIAVVTGFNVRADYKDFAGSAGFSQARVSESNTKNNNEYLAGVNWKTSDRSGHKMWFRIKNSNGEERGRILINRPGNGVSYFDTTGRNGYYYWLYANREHLGNPSSYVTGTWQP